MNEYEVRVTATAGGADALEALLDLEPFVGWGAVLIADTETPYLLLRVAASRPVLAIAEVADHLPYAVDVAGVSVIVAEPVA